MVNGDTVRGKAVVIGAGTMGGGIAAQLANAGWETWLLDVADLEATGHNARSAVALAGLERVKRNRPPLLFLPAFAERIHPGNVEDDFGHVSDADWVVEAVAERMEVKQSLMARLVGAVGRETLVSSNTSGLSLNTMAQGLPTDFRRRFFGTHFLNPPRYLKLLEVAAIADSDAACINGFVGFAEQVLGHRVARAKDTPGFISTRLWIDHLMATMHAALHYGLTTEEVDLLTGSLLGRPRSATFRMADLVGLDILAAIAAHQAAALPLSPEGEALRLPGPLRRLIADERLGDKSGAGFYRREGNLLQVADLSTLEYRPPQQPNLQGYEALARLPLRERFRALQPDHPDFQYPWFQFLHQILVDFTGLVQRIGPEIADDVATIDQVMQWGFGWELGPFEIDDAMVVVPSPGNYSGQGIDRKGRHFADGGLYPIPFSPTFITLETLQAQDRTVEESPEAVLIDLDDGIACIALRSKLNIFSPLLCETIDRLRERAEREFRGLVIDGFGPHFSAGFDLKLLLDAAHREDWAAIASSMERVQLTFQAIKYAPIPTVAAVHGYCLGGGCECALHCTRIQASPETMLGLPELLAGLVPSGGGIKELLHRAMQGWTAQEDLLPRVGPLFEQLALAPRNAYNAWDARQMGMLRPEDRISRNADSRLYEAKQFALALANAAFTPCVDQDVWVGGASLLAQLQMQLNDAHRAGKLSDYDRTVAAHIAVILCGGSLPYAQWVKEAYLLRLEREALTELAHDPLTLARMESLLATGKPLKN